MLQLNRAPKHIERYLQPLRRQVIGLPVDQWFAVAQTSALRARIRLQKAGHKQTARYLACTGRPAIIVKRVSGRIVNYLKAMLGDPGHNVIFTGYQARSAAGPSIKKYGPQGGFVELEGQRCIIRAGESTLAGNWARADQQDLLNFVSGREQRPEQISLVHGEIVATQILKKAVGLASNTQ